jgi:two-component system phosphate regulon sensor histidine kinase PhoR
MTRFFRKKQTTRLRAFRAYLLIVLICTLLLFASNVLSLRQLEPNIKGTSVLSEAQAQSELWFISISIFLILAALGIGGYLFVRVTWDIRWFELRSDFVSGVTHEFKTPLSLIRLYSETLVGNEQDFSPEDRRNYIRIIARESERMTRLIDNVLDFSKMEKGAIRQKLPEGANSHNLPGGSGLFGIYLMWRGFDLKTSIPPQLSLVRFRPEQVS